MLGTLPDFVLYWAERTPEALCVAEPETGTTLSYAQMAARIAAFRAELSRRGVQRGDRVALLADNSCAWVIAYIGAMAHGAIPVVAHTRLAAGDLAPALSDLDPALVIGDPAYLTRLPESYRGGALDTDALIALPPAGGLASCDARREEIGAICYTSGTTGEPRGVVLGHDALATCALTYAQLFQAGPYARTAVVCPLFHNTGYNDGLAHMLVAGGATEVWRRFAPEPIARGLAEGRLTYFVAVPTVYSRMVEPLSGLTRGRVAPWLGYGGAPMPAPVAERVEALLPAARLVNLYGLSEATAVTHYLPWLPISRDLSAIGMAVPGTADRIVESGELQVDSPTVMRGYWNNEAATRAKMDGRWLRTGDAARRGDDGFLRLIGRLDELINRGGEKIAPFEVESAICAHADVVEAAVVGVPDRDLGEVPAAAVVTRAGSALDAQLLGGFLTDRIADYKRPRRVVFVEALPKNPNGKVLKEAVRRLLVER